MPGSGAALRGPRAAPSRGPGAPAPPPSRPRAANAGDGLLDVVHAVRRRRPAAGSRAAGPCRRACGPRRPSRRPARCARSATGTPARRSRPAGSRSSSSRGRCRRRRARRGGRRRRRRGCRRAASAGPERGSTAWNTSAGNDTWLAATERSGSSSPSASISTSVSRCTARWRALERRREDGVEQAALGCDHAHAAGEAGVLRHVRPEEGADGEVGAGVRARDRHVHARRRSARLEPDRSTTSVPSSTAHGGVHAHRRRALEALVVEEALGLDGAVGPGAERGLGAPGGRARSSASMPVTHRVRAVCVGTARRRASSPRRQAASCASRSPSVECRVAHVGRDQLVQRPHAGAALDQLARPGRSAPPGTARCTGRSRCPGSGRRCRCGGRSSRPRRSMRPSRKSGVNTCRSGVWVPPMYGWLVEHGVAGRRRRRPTSRAPPPARTASARAGPGSARSCATMRPSAVNRPQLKSSISRMIGEYEERYSTTAISSAMWWNALARISCVIGSIAVGRLSTPSSRSSTSVPRRRRRARASRPGHHDRGVLLLDDRLGADRSRPARAHRAPAPSTSRQPPCVDRARRAGDRGAAGRPRRRVQSMSGDACQRAQRAGSRSRSR